jgi:hypothetical protein
MKPEAISQGVCDCGNEEDNYSITERELGDWGLYLSARCTCGKVARALIPSDEELALTGTNNISWESASWNEEQD